MSDTTEKKVCTKCGEVGQPVLSEPEKSNVAGSMLGCSIGLMLVGIFTACYGWSECKNETCLLVVSVGVLMALIFLGTGIWSLVGTLGIATSNANRKKIESCPKCGAVDTLIPVDSVMGKKLLES